ncbi:unnamed protein product [Dovyalis caffra]|uniref:Uncharacterized protein n=1 Tax=Dovyalis caffra TaxID=77055 RepID=A0AAV1RCN3_9ROSI|nr:unnamed protein product [Dovyalis caffra]
MANRVVQTPLIIQDENLGVSRKSIALDVFYGYIQLVRFPYTWLKAGFDGSVKNSKTTTKKSGVALGSRKALNDITNKTAVRQEASSRKKNVQKEEINVAEERFLHDHSKCTEEKEATLISSFLDLVLPGPDPVSTAENPEVKQVKIDPDSRFYSEPKELPMPVFSDWFESSTHWHSSPCSPIHWDSPPSSPFSWQFEAVEYVLKPDSDV